MRERAAEQAVVAVEVSHCPLACTQLVVDRLRIGCEEELEHRGVIACNVCLAGEFGEQLGIAEARDVIHDDVVVHQIGGVHYVVSIWQVSDAVVDEELLEHIVCQLTCRCFHIDEVVAVILFCHNIARSVEDLALSIAMEAVAVLVHFNARVIGENHVAVDREVHAVLDVEVEQVDGLAVRIEHDGVHRVEHVERLVEAVRADRR